MQPETNRPEDLHTANQPSEPLVTHCASHPKVETSLRCGKCARPICPKCLIFTPVGARCRPCANLRPLPVFQVGPLHYARALLAALAVALLGGFLWPFVGRIPFFGWLVALGIGYAAGEAISKATNRKRGRGLQVMAGATVLLAYLVQGWVVLLSRAPGLVLDASVFLQVSLAQFAALFSLANSIGLLVFAFAIYIAASRI